MDPSIQASTPPSLPLPCIQPSIPYPSLPPAHPESLIPFLHSSSHTSRRHPASQLADGIHPSLPFPALRALLPGRSTATPPWPISHGPPLSLSLYCTLSPQVPADPNRNADRLASDGDPGAASLRLGLLRPRSRPRALLLRPDAPPLGFSGQQATEVIG